MGNDPTEQRPEHRFGSERVKKTPKTLPKYYQRRSKSRLLSSAVLSDAVGEVLEHMKKRGSGPFVSPRFYDLRATKEDR